MPLGEVGKLLGHAGTLPRWVARAGSGGRWSRWPGPGRGLWALGILWGAPRVFPSFAFRSATGVRRGQPAAHRRGLLVAGLAPLRFSRLARASAGRALRPRNQAPALAFRFASSGLAGSGVA